jgi:nitrogen fixation NifU-like protein
MIFLVKLFFLIYNKNEGDKLYSEKVKDHFKNPRNVGEMSNPDAIGEVGNPTCGDVMKIYLKVNKETQIIEDISFQTFGCAAAIACSSMVTELAKGKTLDDAEKISRKDIADNLGGLPPIKMHCSNLGADALKLAIEKYKRDHGLEFQTKLACECHRDCSSCSEQDLHEIDDEHSGIHTEENNKNCK